MCFFLSLISGIVKKKYGMQYKREGGKMEKKKKTMQDYIELTPDMIRKNVQKNEELTKVLVDEFNRDHFDSILIIESGSSYNTSMGARPFLKKIMKMKVDAQQIQFLH